MKQYEANQEAQPGKVFWLRRDRRKHYLVLGGTPGVLPPPTATSPTPRRAGTTITAPTWFMRPRNTGLENSHLKLNSETTFKL
jgi:hypothetical protein